MSKKSGLTRFFAGIGKGIDLIMRWLFRIIFVLMLFALIGVFVSNTEPPVRPSGSYLVINPKGAIVEQSRLAQPIDIVLGGGGGASTSIRDINEALQLAAGDASIAGLVLDMSELSSISPAALETVGAALQDFKSSNKPVIAYGEVFTQQQYYLASFADTVYLHSMGQILLSGYGGSQLFYAELLEKLGVNVHIFRVGTHKAAVEPYMLNAMSPESKENSQNLVDGLWSRYIARVAQNRELSEEQVDSYAQDFSQHLQGVGGDTARAALDLGLVDELITAPQWRQILAAQTNSDNGRPNTVEMSAYLTTSIPVINSDATDVAVIVAQGEIVMGEQGPGQIGSDNLTSLIRRAEHNDDIKALVLRIDSPGGSATASELIRQQLNSFQASGKPLVVSMAGTAASGGYWISANADQIWASPASVTGSIGIYGMIPTFERSLEKLGVTTDGVSTTPFGRADPLAGMTPEMSQVFQTTIENGYRQFIQIVAQGRGMSLDAVDAIAQGQVWSGERALENGLVDKLGELSDAIESAAQLAGLDDYNWRYFERSPSPAELFLQQLMNDIELQGALSIREAATQKVLGLNIGDALELKEYASLLGASSDPRNVYLRCEFCSSMK
ncbi:MAG: signal peptide peptidase SppA [Pseudohongiellaceae bacterium]|nr:signal peptide peptidase SppA [Pseudohongiellaceae bacterium]